MKTTVIKGWRWFLSAFLSVLGFSGCFSSACRKEYGCPTAGFKLVGDVKDANGKGIEGIRVVFRPESESGSWADTTYSDAQGHFEKERLKYSAFDTNDASVKFEDVDGSAHGSFKTKIVDHDALVVEQTRKGDKHWYYGEYTIRVDAVLEEED